MKNDESQEQKRIDQPNKVVKRSDVDKDLMRALVSGPELFLTEKGSNEYLDKLALKIKLMGGGEFTLADVISEVMSDYEAKFHKYWWHQLADLYNIDRVVMDKYVKPDFARKFLVQFIYGRFPYMVLRTLRSRNRRVSKEGSRTKLFQHMTKSASEQLDVVIEQVYQMMKQCQTPMEFKLKYSKEYKVYFQLELF
ncbi:MAG: hypothetical protein EOP04_02935 [Proteobacteria bacterium]|nr:MAG: hypothetical protein EOP04_02935 [Pseudomonadota bacterium]